MVLRVVGHGGAVGAVALLAGVCPHGAAATVVSIAYLAGYLVCLAGRCLLGVLRWAKTFTSELLEFLPMAGRVPSAVRECHADWRKAPPVRDGTPIQGCLGGREGGEAVAVGAEAVAVGAEVCRMDN
jgi:hypothetical protein